MRSFRNESGFRCSWCSAPASQVGPRRSTFSRIWIPRGKTTSPLSPRGKSSSYIRIQLPNGTFVPETYVFGAGGVWRGERVDATIDKLQFLDVAKMIAGPLASQNYIPAKNPGTTKLLIMVYWGTGHGQEHASEATGYVDLQAAQAARDNARMQAGGPPSGPGGGSVLNSYPKDADEMAADDRLTSAMSTVVAETTCVINPTY
jgi:hypothetical protein